MKAGVSACCTLYAHPLTPFLREYESTCSWQPQVGGKHCYWWSCFPQQFGDPTSSPSSTELLSFGLWEVLVPRASSPHQCLRLAARVPPAHWLYVQWLLWWVQHIVSTTPIKPKACLSLMHALETAPNHPKINQNFLFHWCTWLYFFSFLPVIEPLDTFRRGSRLHLLWCFLLSPFFFVV